MFCPECGVEDKNGNQFCRGCGTDLRRVRLASGLSDSVTASAVSARDEIGRAIAAKIRDTHSASELAVVAEDVLPEIEKFLESPEEKRLRRMRAGTIISCVGLGAAIGITVAAMAMNGPELMFIAALGFVTFFIGLSFLLNGFFLTAPKRKAGYDLENASGLPYHDEISGDTSDLKLPEPSSLFSSVTENTTKHLTEKVRVQRDV